MKNPTYRFFYHFRKSTKSMTVHWKNSCLAAQNVICNVACETKWSDKQPRLVMRGFCKNVEIKNGTAIIS